MDGDWTPLVFWFIGSIVGLIAIGIAVGIGLAVLFG